MVQGFDHSAGGEVQIGIVVVDDFVNLPQIEMIGLETFQRFFELPHGHLFIAAMRADLGHQKHFVAFAGQRLAHPFLAAMVVVFPGVVEEVDAGVDGFVDDLRWLP